MGDKFTCPQDAVVPRPMVEMCIAGGYIPEFCLKHQLGWCSRIDEFVGKLRVKAESERQK